MSEAALKESWYSPVLDALDNPPSISRPLKTPGNGYGANKVQRIYVGTGTCIGWKAIADYLGVNIDTPKRWEKHQRFPICRLPDGRVMTTLSLIDQWVMARIEAQRAEPSAR